MPVVGKVLAICRYPVKSFGGERIPAVRVGGGGLRGDRTWFLRDRATGMKVTARQAPVILRFRARRLESEPGGLPRVRVATPEGEEWDVPSDRILSTVRELAGIEAAWEHSPVGEFDRTPIHLLSSATVRALERAAARKLDFRRFRPSLYVELSAEKPYGEDEWIGGRLRCGEAELAIVGPCERCEVASYDPDSGARDDALMSVLEREHGMMAGVYAGVLSAGVVREGDLLEFGRR